MFYWRFARASAESCEAGYHCVGGRPGNSEAFSTQHDVAAKLYVDQSLNVVESPDTVVARTATYYMAVSLWGILRETGFQTAEHENVAFP